MPDWAPEKRKAPRGTNSEGQAKRTLGEGRPGMGWYSPHGGGDSKKKAAKASRGARRVRNTAARQATVENQPWHLVVFGAVVCLLAAVIGARSAPGTIGNRFTTFGAVELAASAALAIVIVVARTAGEEKRRRRTALAVAAVGVLCAHPLVATVLGGFAGAQWLEPSESVAERRRRAAIRACWPAVAALADLPDGTSLQGVTSAPTGWELEVVTPRGIGSDAVVKKGQQLASAIRRKLRLHPTSDNHVTVEVEERKSPLLKVTHRPDVPVETIKKGVPFGLDERGKTITLPMFESSGLIGGEPGGGKSVGLSLIIAAALEAPDAVVYAVDMKGGVELSVWGGMLDREAVEPAEVAELMSDVDQEMRARMARLREKGARKLTPTAKDPLIVLIVDELAQLDSASMKALERILALGRAPGISVWAATQRPSASLIPTNLRTLFRLAVGFRSNRKTDSDVILGQGWRGEGVCGTELPGPGHCWIIGDKGPQRGRTFQFTDAAIKKVARRNPPPSGGTEVGTDLGTGRRNGTEHAGMAQVTELRPAADSAGERSERNTERRAVGPNVNRVLMSSSIIRDAGQSAPAIVEQLASSRDALTARELAARCGCSDRHARGVLNKLTEAGITGKHGFSWQLRGDSAQTLRRLDAGNSSGPSQSPAATRWEPANA